MRRTTAIAIALALAVGAVATAGVAVAQKPTTVRAGNVILKVNGGFAPKRLPKHRMAPIALRVAGAIFTTDGSQVPVTRRVIADFDRHGRINARGLATCRRGQLEARTTVAAKRVCTRAIVGGGRTTVRVAFPESQPFTSTGPLVIFNGGVRRGVTTMFIHAYVNVPAPTAVVTVVQVRRVKQGRFGTRAIARIPVIAGGAGAVKTFNFLIKRRFIRGGKRQGYLLARCRDGRLMARADMIFRGAPRLKATIVRPCQVRR